MSRADALVTADWAEREPQHAGHRLRRGRRGHLGLRRRAHRRRRQAGLEGRPAGQGPARLREQGAVRGAAELAGASATTTPLSSTAGNNNWFAAYAYWYFTLYGHNDVKLLDGGRKKSGSWTGASCRRTPCRGRPRTTRPRNRTSRSGVRDEGHQLDRHEELPRHPLARRVLGQAARPGPTCRRSSRSAPVTSRARATSRGARPPTRTGPSSPTPRSRRSTTRPAWI